MELSGEVIYGLLQLNTEAIEVRLWYDKLEDQYIRSLCEVINYELELNWEVKSICLNPTRLF